MERCDLSFGYGPRAYLGKQVAELEIYKSIPILFGLFDVCCGYSSLLLIGYRKEADSELNMLRISILTRSGFCASSLSTRNMAWT